MDEKFEGGFNASENLNRLIRNSVTSNMNAETSVEDLRRYYVGRAQRRIELYRDSEQQYLDGMLREIDERTEDQIIRLKEAFNENSGKWIEDIFNSIVSDT